MKICGINEYTQLNEKSNTSNISGSQCISPPLNSHLDISSLLSFSISSDHSVSVTKENRAFAIGSNEGYRIIQTLPEEIINNESEILIQDNEGNLFNFISAVCGSFYTLYLITSSNTGANQLAYVHRSSNFSVPLFVNINGYNPKYLFGGEKISAVICSKGYLFIITKSIVTSPHQTVKPTLLPNNEKAVCVCCCNSFVVVLSEKGRCFISTFESEEETWFEFELVKELEKEEIIEISGTSGHCLAVTKSGRVFAYGSNSVGKLEIGGDVFQTDKFEPILSLQKCQIVSASAGQNHSLFISSEGKVFACGSDSCGQLFLENQLKVDFYCFPVETTIQKGATFCIAGGGLSAVFVDCKPPPNTPNQAIKFGKKNKKNGVEIEGENKDLLIEKLKKQNELLLFRLRQIDNKNDKLEIELFSLKNENEKHLKIEEEAKKEFIQSKDKLFKLKKMIDDLNKKDDGYSSPLNKEGLNHDDADDLSMDEKFLVFKNQIKEKEEENNLLKEEIKKLHLQIHQDEEKMNKLKYINKEELNKLQDQINAKEEENNLLKEEMNELKYINKEELNELQDQINAKEEENNLLKKEMNKLKDLNKEELSKLQIQINAKEEEENKLLKEEMNKLKDQNKEELNKLQIQVNKKEEENEALNDEIIKLKDQNKKEKEANALLKADLNQLQSQVNKDDIKGSTIQTFDVSSIESLDKDIKIGRGATSEVYKVIKKVPLALKILDIKLCQKEANSDDEENEAGEEEEDIEIDIDKMKRFFFEYEAMNRLNHPNIAKVFGFCFGDSKHQPSILLEYYPFNLAKKIKKLDPLERINVLIEICSAMKEVHKQGFIHRDLKPENILLDEKNHVKLCDFGHCALIKKETDSTSRTQMTGTLSFMAPELIQCKKDYDQKVDVYAFGVVAFLIFTKGKYPDIGIMDVGNGKMAEIPDYVTEFSKELIKRCWAYKASDRPSFDELYETLIYNKAKIFGI